MSRRTARLVRIRELQRDRAAAERTAEALALQQAIAIRAAAADALSNVTEQAVPPYELERASAWVRQADVAVAVARIRVAQGDARLAQRAVGVKRAHKLHARAETEESAAERRREQRAADDRRRRGS